MDKAIGPGSYGALYQDIVSSLYDLSDRPLTVDYVYGLGGRDLTQDMVANMIEQVKEDVRKGRVENKIRYLGVRW